MGFFDSFNKKDKKSIYDSKLEKARTIVARLGKEKNGGLYRIKGGQYYLDHVYEGYGLKIVKPDYRREEEKDVYVVYKGNRVLDYNTYIPGSWEGVFNELYQSIDAIIDEKRRERELLAKKDSLLTDIAFIPGEGTINIGNGIKIIKYERWGGSYDQYDEGTNCQVYKNEELVFDAFYEKMYGSNGNKHHVYIPGSWEEKVRQYAKYAAEHEERKPDKEAIESIKQLRKIRGE